MAASAVPSTEKKLKPKSTNNAAENILIVNFLSSSAATSSSGYAV
jgi:hypothetical protein